MSSTEQRQKWREKAAKWRAEHPGYDIEQKRKWRLKNPDYNKRMWIEHPEYAENQRKWRAEHRDDVNAKTKEWQRRNTARYLFTNAKIRANKTKKSFSLTRLWVEKKLAAGICEQTGKFFDFKKGGEGILSPQRNPWFPSIDRIDSSLGYTEENCQIVCALYNFAKGDWDDSDVLEMANWLVKTKNDKTLKEK